MLVGQIRFWQSCLNAALYAQAVGRAESEAAISTIAKHPSRTEASAGFDKPVFLVQFVPSAGPDSGAVTISRQRFERSSSSCQSSQVSSARNPSLPSAVLLSLQPESVCLAIARRGPSQCWSGRPALHTQRGLQRFLDRLQPLCKKVKAEVNLNRRGDLSRGSAVAA